MSQQLKLNIEPKLTREQSYWKFIESLPGKQIVNIQRRAKYVLTNFIEADKIKETGFKKP